MVQALHKFTPLSPPGNGRIECRLQDQFGLLERIPLTKVPQELKEPDIPWQVAFTDTPEHSEVGLEQRKQALGSILMHVTTDIFLTSSNSRTHARSPSPP